MKQILLVLLEFDTWNHAKSWSYSGSYAFYDGLVENGHICTVLPAISGRGHNASDSFVHVAPEILDGNTYDEAWVWCVHTSYGQDFWNWLKTVAPIRVGVVMESLTHTKSEISEFPHLATREEKVLEELKNCTHALMADEADVERVKLRLGLPAVWNVPMIPERFVRHLNAPDAPNAGFIGSCYGSRRSYINNPILSSLLERPLMPEWATDLPTRFDTLHQETTQRLLTQNPSLEALKHYADELRALREKLFELSLDGIRSNYCSVNLPSIVKTYPGRVFEAIASATPVSTWAIPDRPQCANLFKAGEEISLFSTEQELITELQQFKSSQKTRECRALLARNTLLARHTSRIRMRQYSQWIDSAIEPDFFVDLCFKPDIKESLYYKELFSLNPYWSIPTPNDDESARWGKIRELIVAVRSLLGRPLQIVEIGCGRGWLANLCSEFGQVTAVEPVGDVVAHAKLNFPHINFLTGDADLLNYLGYEEKFDLVICSEVIEHIPRTSKSAFIRSVTRLANAGSGYLIITTPRKDIKEQWEQSQGTPNQPIEDWVSEQELKKLFEEAGCYAQRLERAFILDIYQIWLFQKLPQSASPTPLSNETQNPPKNPSFFSSRRNPYYIFSPDYSQSAAGIRCLHYLCHALNELGEEAYITPARIHNSKLRTPILTPEIVCKHYGTGRTPIAVYPEVIPGNPLSTPLVARWLLNKPGHLTENVQFHPSDLIFFFQEWCLPKGMQGDILNLPTVDASIFNNHNNPADKKRKGACYYANKYLAFGGKIDAALKRSATSLCLDIPRSSSEIAGILRKSEVLYCYEQSSIVLEAIACGCPVLIMPSEYWDLHGSDERVPKTSVRLASEPDAIKKSQRYLADFGAPGEEWLDMSWGNVRQFIQITQTAAARHICIAENRPHKISESSPLIDFWMLDASQRTQAGANFAQRILRLPLVHTDTLSPKPTADAPSSQSAEINRDTQEYGAWISTHQLGEIDARYFQEHVAKHWKQRPLFEFMLVLHPGHEALLADTIDSLARQFYDGWRLSIFAQSPSPDPEFESEASHVRWIQCGEAAALASAMNLRLQHSSANWIGLFECGAQFVEHLLLVCGDYIATRPDWRLIYSDEDTIDADGSRYSPLFKPDLNIDYLRSVDYIGSIFVEKSALIAAGGHPGNRGGEKYDIALRILDAYGEASIGHIPDVLYHTAPAVAQCASNEGAIAALQAHFSRNSVDAEILPGLIPGQLRRIHYRHAATPRVSIIIANKDRLDLLGECIESLLANTRYPDWELLIVDNESEDADTPTYYEALAAALPGRCRILSAPGQFNFAAMNNLAAREASGDYLLLLHNDTLAIHDDWLFVMMRHAQRAEIGMVGARLVSSDGKLLQHAGRVLGMCGTTGNVFAGGLTPEDPGYMLRAAADQNYSALEGACLLVRKSLYLAAGGMDEEAFKLSQGDTDLCLKIGKLGYKAVWTPFATLIHRGGATLNAQQLPENLMQQRAFQLQQEAYQLAKHWLPQLADDPAWNRNLSLASTIPATEAELAATWNPDFRDRPRILWMPLASPGQAEYRSLGPMNALHEAGMAQCAAICQPRTGYDRAPTPFELARLAPDTLIMHAPVDDVRFIGLMHYKEINRDILRVYSLDDLLTNIPTGSYVHRKLPSALMAERLRIGLAASDRLIVSTEPLAEACRGMIDDIRIVPNTLKWSVWGALNSSRRKGKKLRVGWAGAQQHAGDLAFMLDVIKATHKEVDWVFFGMMPHGATPYVSEFHEFVHHFADYPAKLATLDLDLAVAPLEIHPFNEAKSNLRLLEYGSLGWPVICTDILPYRTDKPPVTHLPNDAERWISAIRERIGNSKSLAAEGDALRAWVRKHYLLEDHLAHWLKAVSP